MPKNFSVYLHAHNMQEQLRLTWRTGFVVTGSLAENWFEPSGHIGVGQRIITIGKETDLEVWPKANEGN